jgi:CubicO group peptidase (beta-lactamase class C family)
MSMIILTIALLPVWGASISSEEPGPLISSPGLTESKKKAIEEYIGKQMKIGKIPGMAVVIVKGDQTVYSRGFGYANLKTKQQVTTQTLFELGSTSKAFTALGILILEKKGLLNMNDPVKNYIPWLTVKYKGKNVEITLEQFLYQTSGIPFKSIVNIPAASDNKALENVLFAEYMKTEQLEPLAVHNTYLFRDEARRHGLATGYKICFGKAREYDAPEYRGNTPAGYFITNAEDMSQWLKIQMQVLEPPGFKREIIKKSHEPNAKIGSAYAAGWFVVGGKAEQSEQGVRIFHGGENPNFSSFIVFIPGKQLGAAVLANIRSSYAGDIPLGVLNILAGKQPGNTPGDQVLGVDRLSVIIVIVSLVFILVVIAFLVVFTRQFLRKKRKSRGFQVKGVLIFLLLTLFLVVLYYLLYLIPDILFWELTWEFILVWGPGSLLYAVMSIITASFLIYLYSLLRYLFPKSRG